MVEVINLKYCKDFGKDGDVYIGRKFRKFPQSKWANPIVMTSESKRDFVCDLYNQWLAGELQSGRLDINELIHAERLGCWCKEKDKEVRCHGDILVMLIERRRTELKYD